MPNSHRPPDTTRQCCQRRSLDMQQSTACLHFRGVQRCCVEAVGPARPARGGGGRQAGAAVLSCLVWRCELAAGQVRSASECVRRSHCAAGRTPTQTRHRTHLSGGRADSIHTATPDTTKQSCLCRVWRGGVNKLQSGTCEVAMI